MQTRHILEELKSTFNGFFPQVRRRFLALLFMQSFINFLDVVGLLGLGLLVSISSSTDNLAAATNNSSIFGFKIVATNQQVILYSLLFISLFILKNFFAILLLKRMTAFLAMVAQEKSQEVLRKLFYRGSYRHNDLGTEQLNIAMNLGTNSLYIVGFSVVSIIISDLFLLILFSVVLIFLNWQGFLIVTLLFISFSFFISKYFSKSTLKASMERGESATEIQRSLTDLISAFPEFWVSGRQDALLSSVIRQQNISSNSEAKILLFNQLPKYIFEPIMIIGLVLVILTNGFFLDPENQLTIAAIFIGAGMRALPSIIRIYSSLNVLKSYFGYIHQTLQMNSRSIALFEEFKGQKEFVYDSNSIINQPATFVSDIVAENISFKYPLEQKSILSHCSFQIHAGAKIAISGRSGSGKSTLLKLVAGLLTPTSGSLLVSSIKATEIPITFPKMVSYLPQKPHIFSTSISKNLLMGLDEAETCESDVRSVLECTGFDLILDQNKWDLDTDIDFANIKLSGGQVQRLAIARALLHKPRLLLLDEATNALDSVAEKLMHENIRLFLPESTIIFITHNERLFSDCEMIIKLDA